MTPNRRAWSIIGFILFAHLALLLFWLVPQPWNIPFLFLNGLPLGMVWGLVFSFLEGRKTTELLGGRTQRQLHRIIRLCQIGRVMDHEYLAGIRICDAIYNRDGIFAAALLFCVDAQSDSPSNAGRRVYARQTRTDVAHRAMALFSGNLLWALP